LVMRRHRRRNVLVVVPSVLAGTWLTDALPLLAEDRRIVTFFTVAPAENGSGVAEFLRAEGCLVLPWRHAVQREFDLVLAAGPDGLSGLRGNSLLLRESAGELCYDRLLASIPFRAGYRRAFGLCQARKLVLVTVDDQRNLLDRLLLTLPLERYKVVPVPRPGGWEAGWRGALIAADVVVGSGLVVRYGAAIGVPVLLAAADGPRQDDVDGLVARHAPRLRLDHSLFTQVEAAMLGDRMWQDRVAERIAPMPGYAGDALRSKMYGLLGLTEPAWAAPCYPVPFPRLNQDDTRWCRHSIGLTSNR
jgi:hypothetical protein